MTGIRALRVCGFLGRWIWALLVLLRSGPAIKNRLISRHFCGWVLFAVKAHTTPSKPGGRTLSHMPGRPGLLDSKCTQKPSQ
jgi:hypothetical protein